MPDQTKCRARWRLLAAATLVLGWPAMCLTDEVAGNPESQAVSEPEPVSEAVEWLQEYIRIDTTNPPGNEAKAVEFLAKILRANGIRYRVAEPVPGRKNLWARLEGGDEPALLLLHHTDVVSADPDFWDVGPFAGEIVDGHVYGRGALDMKSHGIIHLATFVALHRNKVRLNRDVVFMATADEEAGSQVGMGWMVSNKPAAFSGVGLALTEGGQATLVGDRIAVGIEVTQKVPLWLRLESTGPAGHGSTPKTTSALGSLIDALANLRAHEFAPRIVPAVDSYFKKLAPNFPGRLGSSFANIESAVHDPAFRQRLREMLPNLSALISNTCSITRVTGSDKVNVVAPTASAEIDCRLLPDQEPVSFLAEIERVLDDDSIWIDPMLSYGSSASDTDTALYAAIENVMAEQFPGVEAVPTVSAGFTDSHYLRERGIASYGFAPFVVPVADTGGYHGNNERISVDNIDRGVELLTEIVTKVVNPGAGPTAAEVSR
ncbi:MAG: M20/M25/M40 family metallo-hydrolase [Gammaproteobacteria bacterium]|nr:M20/M25/M40 family metallo-hydrolase [Gammaproteobacteria bacterium]